MATLAINGGTPIRKDKPYPSVGSAAGRTFGKEELANLTEAIESGMLNRSGGKFVPQVEQKWAEHLGVKHCTVSTSGTAAIHVAVGAINPNPGDEIITGPITDMGTVIPILAQNCIPVFGDLRRDNIGLDAADVERRITERTKAIIPVHLCGNATDMDPLMALAEKYNLKVIEDCSQAYGTLYKGKHVGTIGHMGTFSLQQSKHISTGDGGLTVTNDDALGERAVLFANKGWPNYGKSERNYVMFGMCYRMTELQAAVLDAQIGKVDWVTARRNEIGDMICAAVGDCEGLEVPGVSEGGKHTYWFLPLLVDQEELGIATSKLAQALSAEGAPCGAHYIGQPIFMYDLLRQKKIYGDSTYPFSLQPEGQEVRYEKGECPQTERILDDLLQVSVNEMMTDEDVSDIIACFEKVWANLDELRAG
ncbi:DegT/DnrJ/EryC1/StrS family aminotransferase [bacterium]|nr:DegT/DnrJ/EryC1/StrS family aminotransferase [bacterium]